MVRRLYYALLLVAIVAVPGGLAVWRWQQGPDYERRRRLAAVEAALAANNLARAEDLLRELLHEDPNQARTQFLYAQVLRRLGRGQEAWLPLARAGQLGLPRQEGLRERALLEATDNFREAEPALQAVLESRPDDPETLQALAEGYFQQRRWLDAERTYTRWLEIDPQNEDVRLRRAEVLMHEQRQAQAEQDLRAVLGTAPQRFEARLLLAQCLEAEGKTRPAEAELQLCRQLRPSHPAPLLELAACALEEGDLDRARQLTQEARRLAPDSLLVLHFEGDLELRRRRYDLAIPIFERIVRLAPRDRQAHLKLAQSLQRTGDTERARKHERVYEQLEAAENNDRDERSGKPGRPGGDGIR
jgi:cellulose synthase operon protein C